MSREINSHKVNECNDAITIVATDQPGSGGANHQYLIYTPQIAVKPGVGAGGVRTELYFQNGPIKEVGTNGITHEVLLAIVIDRMQSFQKGPYACRENAIALTKLEEAVHWLQHRTRARVARGVEGTHEK